MDRFNTFKLFIEEHKNKLIVCIIFLVILLFSTLFFLNIDQKVTTKTDSIVFSNSNEKEVDVKDENLNQDNYIYVDIKGEVNSPGVYSIENGKRVVDAINLAGGLKESSDTTLLNLSTKLVDQMVIVVYSKDNIKNIDSLKQELEEKSIVCEEEIKNDACIVNNKEIVIVPDIIEKHDEVKETNNTSSKVNINTSSLSELTKLPKIGNVKAQAIISYRENNGDFKSIQEIKNVKGIGDSLFESIKDFITV